MIFTSIKKLLNIFKVKSILKRLPKYERFIF
jgi:hypothetical protein